MVRGPLRLERHARLIEQAATHGAQVGDIAASRKEWVAAITHSPVHCNKLAETLLHVVRHCARNERRPTFAKVLWVAQVAQNLQPALGVAPLHQLAHRLSKQQSDI